MFTEESLENVVIEYLTDIDYTYINGSNLTRDNKEVLLLNKLVATEALRVSKFPPGMQNLTCFVKFLLLIYRGIIK